MKYITQPVNDGDPHPYHALPAAIQEWYQPPNVWKPDLRPSVIAIKLPHDRRIEISTGTKTDVWVWDTDNPGHGRWLQIG